MISLFYDISQYVARYMRKKFIVPANDQSLTLFATTGKRTRLVTAVAIASPLHVLWGSFVTHSFLRGGEMNA